MTEPTPSTERALRRGAGSGAAAGLPRRAFLAAACASAAALSGARAFGEGGPSLRDGDVVLQTSRSSRSGLIRKATDSPYSHVGVVEVGADGVFVLEAINPVSRTPWGKWRLRGEGGRVTALRPRDLDAAALGRVVAEAKAALGRPYDAHYLWGDESLYCSELVVKAFERGAGVKVGELQRVDSLRLSARELEHARKLGVEPSQELVTPASVARDARFEVLFSDFATKGAPPRPAAEGGVRGAWSAFKRWLTR